MARKQQIVINRFDGGMTDAIRDTSNPTKFAYISHFDIYRDPNQMYVMPGFESFNGFDGNVNGIKVYDAKDIALFGEALHLLLTERADGTGSKLFQLDTGETQWKIPTVYAGDTEGGDDLPQYPFLAFIGTSVPSYFPVKSGGDLRIGRIDNSGYSNSWAVTSSLPATTTAHSRHNIVDNTPTGELYFTYGYERLARLRADAVAWTHKTTAQVLRDASSSDYTITLGTTSFGKSRSLIWDDASLLADQKNNLGTGITRVVGNPELVPSFVIDESAFTVGDSFNENGLSRMTLKILQGESLETILRVPAFRHSTNLIAPSKNGYKGTMTWYAYFSKNTGATSFDNGIWAFGRGITGTQMGVSKLLDTSSLGSVYQTKWFGDNCWFINHSGDGSISRLQNFDTGTYDVPATIETLVYGSNSPYLKELNGISVVTENLPASASVKVDYRTDVDSAWVELGTSNTTNKQKHVFTRAQGTPIGRFQEIQFRITCTGKIVLKNIKIDLTETDDLAF